MSLKVELLEQSFQRIRPHAEEFAASFYENLFAANPRVKPLFAHSDIKKQQGKLLSALVLVVESLRKPEVLKEVLKDLGSRHVSYGAIPKYYPLVGAALLATFEQYLQEDWTPEVKQAWEDAFTAIAALMFEGAGYPAQTLQLETLPTPSPSPHKSTTAIKEVAASFTPPPPQQKLSIASTDEKKAAIVQPSSGEMLKDAASAAPPPLIENQAIAFVGENKAPIVHKSTTNVNEFTANVAPPPPQKSGALQVELLESSFAKIKPQAAQFAASFYENLFVANPRIRPLFTHTDMQKQQEKLLGALVLVIESLRKPQVLKAVLKDLGARHVSYGAIPKYYPLVGSALVTTLAQYLQSDWTEEVKQAWVDAYSAIAALMFEGAGYPAETLQLETLPIPSAGEQKAPILQESITPISNISKSTASTPSSGLEKAPSPQKSGALQVELLESSFAKIKPQAMQFAASFYENLFAANPTVKPLFATTDMQKQQEKLLGALVLVIESLRKPQVLKAVLKDLGARHVAYGAIAESYPLVGAALLQTFEQYLQSDWTEEIKQAWVDAYVVITNVMFEGAGYAPLPVPSQTVPTPSKVAVTAPAPQKSGALQIELLESSFAKIKPQLPEFVVSFYDNLFAANPGVKPLFAHIDMKKQHKKLLAALVLVVESLRKPEALRQVLQDLGSRHVAYGALPKYYPPVVSALLVTLEQYLQQDWTPEVKVAWENAFGTIANVMLSGADYAVPSLPSPPVPTFSNDAVTAPVTEKSPSLQNELIKNKFALLKTQAEAQIKRLTSVVKEGVTTEQIQEKLTASQETLVKWFWELPTWAIASVAAFVLISLVLITDENSPLAKIVGSADAISVLLALILFIKEIPERRKQSHYQAWSIIDGAEGVEVSYARLMALQDLNRDRVSLRGVKVAGAKLENIDLSEAELTEADMSNADLDEANFTSANLNRTNLSFASLTRVNFSRANLSFAKLKGARMAGSNFKNANLLGADLSDALLTGVDLKGANLSAANLKDANLSGASLENATLTGANLEGAIMPDGFQEG